MSDGYDAIQLKKALLGMPVHRSVFIWGPPGVGKSSIVRQVGEELKIPVIDVRLTLLDPTDLRGLPFIRDGEAIWARPVFIPKEDKNGKDGILLLDEINAAPPAVQASAYQLTLDRRLGEHVIPEGWRVWCAGNRETDRAVTYKLPSPLASRLIHLELVPNVDAWVKWALERVDPRVIGFIRWREDLLFKFDPTKHSRAFPCPRSWEFASDILPKFDNEAVDFQRELLTGCVGEGAAAEFLGYLKVASELPQPTEIIDDGKDFVPTDPSALYAMCSGLVHLVMKREKDGKKFTPSLNRLVEYSLKLRPEFSVMVIKDLSMKYRTQLLNAKAWNTWAQRHKNFIL